MDWPLRPELSPNIAGFALQRSQIDHILELSLQQHPGNEGVAMITQLEQQLATALPLAESRLQAIGDMHP